MKIAFVVACAAILVSERASADEAPPLGTPLRSTHSAEPAMTGMSLMVPSAGIFYVPSTPGIHMNGVTAPRRSELFGTIGIGNSLGGGLGLKLIYSIFGADFGLIPIAGSASGAFTDGAMSYTSGRYFWIGFGLPSVGLSWHRTGYVLAAQLVPRLEWFRAVFHDDVPTHSGVSGDAFLFTVSADVLACLEYNFGGLPKNSAVCAYVAPAIYRDDFFNGFTSGVRLFLF